MPRKKKAKRREILLAPYEGLEVKDSPGKGKGVFATGTIKAGTMLPIVGVVLNEKQMDKLIEEDRASHLYSYPPDYTIGIDARPSLDPTNLAIWSRVNEPSKKEKPNCIFVGKFLVIAKRLKAGDELLIWYGDSYKRKGYETRDFTHFHYKELDEIKAQPSKKEKDSVIDFYNKKIKDAITITID